MIDRTWQNCDLTFSLTRPQPTEFFLLGAREIFNVRDICDSAEVLTARIVFTMDKIQTTRGIFERVGKSFLCRCYLWNNTRGRHFILLMWVFIWTINSYCAPLVSFICLTITVVSSGWNSNIPLFHLSESNVTQNIYVIISQLDRYYQPS